ncbi:hypothetical protein ACFYRN_42625 [Streptomyces sp. NPDC005227]|uniref:hypothetical protein n=1 Tax=Streptomyces sp. NPDC005227 TaxID=3364707 RepID=UPI0036C5B3A7
MTSPPDNRRGAAAMVSHALKNGVLILRVDDAPGPQTQNLAVLISDLIHVHTPVPVVITLGAEAADPVLEAVVEAHRRCKHADALISVVTPSAPARRALAAKAAAHGGGLVVHARVGTAIETAGAAA